MTMSWRWLPPGSCTPEPGEAEEGLRKAVSLADELRKLGPAFRWGIVACCWLWALAALTQVTNAGWDLGVGLLLFLPGCLLSLCWLEYSALVPAVFRDRRGRYFWLSVPALMLLLLTLEWTNLGLACRVWMCERELRQYAEAVVAGVEEPPQRGQGKWVGLFFVSRTDSYDTKDVNLITGRWFLESYGITYWPDGAPHGSGDEYQHLYGPWYRYRDDF
jgi:hypothetical protein